MSLPRSRTSRHNNNNNHHYHTHSPGAFRSTPPVSDDLHESADKKAQLSQPQSRNSVNAHYLRSHLQTPSTTSLPHRNTTSKPTPTMGQPPQPPVGAEQPYYFIPSMQSFDSSREAEWQSQPWMMATIIEDDDLTFGGKPLSTWYEEDRRRCSFGDDDDSENGRPTEFVEEERRGRQRDRPHDEKVSHSHHKHHHHHHKSSGKSSTGKTKH